MANVLFKFGTSSEFQSITPVSNAVYFITDTGELYKGSTLIANKNAVHKLSAVGENVTPDAAYDSQVGGNPGVGEIVIVPRTDGTQDSFVYDGNEFVPLNEKIDSDDVVVGKDGNGNPITLTDALENLNIKVDDITIENNENVGLTLKNYGKGYFKYIAPVEAGAAGTYEYVAVSEQNPWKANLQPKVVDIDGVLQLGWYEPSSADGSANVEDEIAALQEAIDRLSDSIGEAFHFAGAVDDVSELPAAAPENQGEVYRVGDSEYASNGEEWIELGSPASAANVEALEQQVDALEDTVADIESSYVKSINIPASNGVSNLTPNEQHIISIPAATTANYGLIKFSANANGKVIAADGTVVDPLDPRIGDLTDDESTKHDTVEEYVQHYINNVTNIINQSLEWNEIVKTV